MNPRKILIPVDGSEGALRAVEYGVELADKIGASVTLLHVYDSSVVAMMGLTTSSGKFVDDAIERVSTTHLNAALSRCPDPSRVKSLMRIGHPAEEICSFADEDRQDLIVLGSRGLSKARSFLVGSVSARVARHAPCSVLIVR